MPFAIATAIACGTIPVSSSMTIDALLIWSRNSTERPPPRKTSLISMAPVCEVESAIVNPSRYTRLIRGDYRFS